MFPLEPDMVLLLLDILMRYDTKFGRAKAIQTVEFGEGYCRRKQLQVGSKRCLLTDKREYLDSAGELSLLSRMMLRKLKILPRL